MGKQEIFYIFDLISRRKLLEILFRVAQVAKENNKFANIYTI